MDVWSILRLNDVWLIELMSTESLNRTSDVANDPSQVINTRVNADVLKHKLITTNNPKRICVNALNRRLHLAKRKDKFKSIAIVSCILVSAGFLSFIVG